MRLVQCLRILARALDWAKDPDPDHWKTINGSHVHLDKNGNMTAVREANSMAVTTMARAGSRSLL